MYYNMRIHFFVQNRNNKIEHYLKVEKFVFKTQRAWATCRGNIWKLNESNVMLNLKSVLSTCNSVLKSRKKKTACGPKILRKQHASAEDDLHRFHWSTWHENAQNHQQHNIVRSRALFNLCRPSASDLRGCADASGTGIQRAERHKVCTHDYSCVFYYSYSPVLTIITYKLFILFFKQFIGNKI